MDIDLLSKMVKELILDNDRVVLPGLGCFVAEIVPSTFSDKGYTINPPYRRLFFRTRPDQGDALTRFYAATNNVEVEIADKIIIDFVSELKSVLFSKKTVIFPGLGRLRATKENNVFFVADEDLDIYPAGFGLEPISLKTHQESAEEVTATVIGLRQILADQESESEPKPIEQEAKPTEHESKPAELETKQVEPEVKQAEREIIEPETKPTPELISEPIPEPEVEPVPENEPESKVESPARRKSNKVLWSILTPVLVAAALFGAFVLISRINPEILDPILYSQEELEILYYKSE